MMKDDIKLREVVDNIGTYREESPIPYGPDETKGRINHWLQAEGKKYKIQKRDEMHLGLKRGMSMNPDIFFNLNLTGESVRAECWVKGFT